MPPVLTTDALSVLFLNASWQEKKKLKLIYFGLDKRKKKLLLAGGNQIESNEIVTESRFGTTLLMEHLVIDSEPILRFRMGEFLNLPKTKKTFKGTQDA